MKPRSQYHKAICQSMLELSNNSRVIFLGQQVLSEDFYGTLTDIPLHQRIEMPVAEEMQLGMSIGLALQGYYPVTIFQRMDFIPRAMDQLVNHLNIIDKVSRNRFTAPMLIRTTVGTKHPLDVGLQHSKDLSKLMKAAVDFPVIEVRNASQVRFAYNMAQRINKPIMIIEYQELYNK